MKINTGANVAKANLMGSKKTEKKNEDLFNIQDKVEIGKNQTDDAGFIHKTFRGLGKLAGGTLGIVPGMVVGGVKGAGSEDVNVNLKPEEKKTLASVGAGAGALIGAIAGTIAIPGPIGLAIGTVLGTIGGAAFGKGFTGNLEGAWAATRGTFKGIPKGFKKGAEIGGLVVDKTVAAGKTVAGWFSSKPTQEEKPAENQTKAA